VSTHHFTSALVVSALLLNVLLERRRLSQIRDPNDAAKALMQAFKADDTQQITASSAARPSKKWPPAMPSPTSRIAKSSPWRWNSPGAGRHRLDRQELIVGEEQWPFPISLAKSGDQWAFDSEAGKHEVLARRIGRNELGQ
jgi:hypothetical protein